MVSMLTTIDNPFDPFSQYDQWRAFDEDLARRCNRPTTCGYLDRIAKTSDDLSDEDRDFAIESAINEIVKFNVLGIYRKVTYDTLK